MQAVVLLTVALVVTDPPAGPQVVRLMWAKSHRPAFYPFVLLITAGPVLSWIAWRTPGRHRTAAVCAWCVFIAILFSVLSERAWGMLAALWWRVS